MKREFLETKKYPGNDWFSKQVIYCATWNKLKRIYPLDASSISENCPICGLEHSNLLDRGIANTIRLFNDKGWNTLFSCSGHPDDFCKGYIYFNIPIVNAVLRILDELPLSWYIDLADLKRNKLIIRTNKTRDDEYPYYLDEIEDFAKKVPRIVCLNY